jgi:hypothetical protein
VAVAELNFLLNSICCTAGHDAPENRLEPGADHFWPNVPMVAADHLLLLAPADAQAFRVHLRDPPAAVHDGETFGHGVKNVLALVTLGTQLGLRASSFGG